MRILIRAKNCCYFLLDFLGYMGNDILRPLLKYLHPEIILYLQSTQHVYVPSSYFLVRLSNKIWIQLKSL